MSLQNMLITICISLCILVGCTPYHLPYTLKGHLTESVTGHRVDLQSPWQAGSQQVTRLKVRLDCYFCTRTPHFRPHGLLWPSSLGMTPVQDRAWFRFWFCDLPWPASRLLLTNGPHHWRNDHYLKWLFATPFRSLPPKMPVYRQVKTGPLWLRQPKRNKENRHQTTISKAVQHR